MKKLHYPKAIKINDVEELKNDSVYPETAVFALICIADMLYTLYVVRAGIAKEANPMLAWAMNISNACFIFVKTLSFALPLAIIELVKHKNYHFFQILLRLGIMMYIVNWFFGVYLINR